MFSIWINELYSFYSFIIKLLWKIFHLLEVTIVIWNRHNVSNQVSSSWSRCGYQFTVKIQQNPKTQQLSKYTVRGKILSRILGILHNMSKRVPTRGSFSACRALDVLIPLLKEDVVLFRTKSLLILAYLIDEENNHLIITDEGKFKAVLK